MDLEERIKKDIELFEKNIDKIRHKRIKDMALRYYEDAKYYLLKKDFPTSFGCINYAHGLIDAILKGKTEIVEFLGSAGSGKTTIIEQIVNKLKIDYDISVIIANFVGKEDCERIRNSGVETICINTGNKMMDKEILEETILGIDDNMDYIFLENVGTLAGNFINAGSKKITVISATQGKEIVMKYPMAFQMADLVIINKIDLANGEEIEKELRKITQCEILKMNAVKGENIEWIIEWIKK